MFKKSRLIITMIIVAILFLNMVSPMAFASFNILGDVNGDGKVSAKDALLTLRYSIKLKQFDDGQKSAADVDNDGLIRGKDALEILRYVIHLSKNDKIGNSELNFGDVNFDGKVDKNDAEYLEKLIKNKKLTNGVRVIADVNFSGSITMSDVILIKNKADGKIKFFPCELFYGDLNGDEEVTADDVNSLENYLKGVVNLEDDKLALADVNYDRKVDWTDLQLIRNKADGKIKFFPTEIMIGDINGDGKINWYDMALIHAYVISKHDHTDKTDRGLIWNLAVIAAEKEDNFKDNRDGGLKQSKCTIAIEKRVDEIIYKYRSGKWKMNDEQLAAADVNFDGTVDYKDLNKLRKLMKKWDFSTLNSLIK